MPGILTDNDLVRNNATRLPIVLCIDVSGSMRGEKLDALNNGIRLFYEQLRNDRMSKYAADIAVVTFSDKVQVLSQFKSIRSGNIPNIQSIGGLTFLGSAVNQSLTLLDNRKLEYKNASLPYYQPWLVLMTDGFPEGEDGAVTAEAAARTSSLERNRKLTVLPFFIQTKGLTQGLDVLRRFSSVNDAVSFNASDVSTFFRWLSQSVSVVSRSTTDAQPNVTIDDFRQFMFSMREL